MNFTCFYTQLRQEKETKQENVFSSLFQPPTPTLSNFYLSGSSSPSLPKTYLNLLWRKMFFSQFKVWDGLFLFYLGKNQWCRADRGISRGYLCVFSTINFVVNFFSSCSFIQLDEKCRKISKREKWWNSSLRFTLMRFLEGFLFPVV